MKYIVTGLTEDSELFPQRSSGIKFNQNV